MYVPIPTCMLRVINNDTGEELKKVFQKVAPQWYRKNKVRLIKYFLCTVFSFSIGIYETVTLFKLLLIRFFFWQNIENVRKRVGVITARAFFYFILTQQQVINYSPDL